MLRGRKMYFEEMWVDEMELMVGMEDVLKK
jgi:hypothetical protein